MRRDGRVVTVRRPVYAVAVLLAAASGAVLRCIGVGTAPLEFDEAASWYFAGLPWGDLVGEAAVLEPNPPLFYAAVHLVRLVFGDGEAALRLPSVLAGVACIPVAAGIARRLGGPVAGIAAALLVASSATLVVSSQYARAYSMLTLAGLLVLAAALRLVAATRRGEPGGAWAWAGFVGAGAAALYLHNTAVLMMAAVDLVMIAAWVAAPGRPPGFAVRWVGANLVIAAAFAPWVPVMVHQSVTTLAAFWLARPGFAELRYGVLGVYAQPYARFAQPIPDLVTLGAGAFGLFVRRRDPALIALVVFVLIGVPLATFGISQWRPLMNGKTLLWLAPVFLVVAGVGCAGLRRLAVPATAVLLAVQVAGCWSFLQSRPDEGYPGLAALLRAEVREGDVLYLSSPELEPALRYYGWSGDRAASFARPVPGTWNRHPVSRPLAVERIGAGAGRVYVVSRSLPALQEQAAEALQGRMVEVARRRFGQNRLPILELRVYGPAG